MDKMGTAEKSVLADVAFEVLHNDFDINTHKAIFIDYLEVVIDHKGKVHYAVPSYTIWLMKEFYKQHASKFGSKFDKLDPYEIYCKFGNHSIEWLCKQTECIAVWSDRYVGRINSEQKKKLFQLKQAGLYKGSIHYAYK